MKLRRVFNGTVFGYTKIPKEIMTTIKAAMEKLRYDTPLEQYDCVGVSFDVNYINFNKGWWLKTYKGEPPVIHCILRYYMTIGYHKEHAEFKNYRINIEFDPRNIDNVYINTDENYYRTDLRYITKVIGFQNEKIDKRYGGLFKEIDRRIIRERNRLKTEWRKKDD
jgi:hypothetical protein